MPEPTDTYEVMQYNMINAHNTFKLGYDRIIELLDNVPHDDLNNFLGYCEAWAVSISSHHEVEEEIVFPFLNQKMDFSGEKQQHEGIHSRLDKLLEMIHTGKAEHSKFDVAGMKELMVEFRGPLYGHLDSEVEHISAANIKASGFTKDEIKETVVKMEAYVKSHADPFIQVPYMRGHTPADLKDEWPALPWILRKVVIPYVLARRYSGYWKYSPYPMS